MRTPAFTRQFERDVKLCRKQGRKLERLKIVMNVLIAGEKLNPLFRDHRLSGEYNRRRECHIDFDWLLIYKLEPGRIIFERTGSHADLFD